MKSKKLTIDIIVIVFIGLFINFHKLLAQDSTLVSEIDTSHFISGNLDFNLLIASEKGYSNIVLNLLNRGADVNASTYEGVSALMFAVDNMHYKTTRILLLNGANPNKVANGLPPSIIVAANQGNLELTEMLIEHGAEPDKLDGAHATALMYACANNDIPMVDLLLYYKAFINRPDRFGNTPLMIASFYGYPELTKYLIDHLAVIDQTDRDGYTAMHCAAQNGQIKTMNVLIQKKSNIEAKTKYGLSPLSISVLHNQQASCSNLIEHGANINSKIAPINFPLNLSLALGHDSITNILKKSGAKKSRIPYFSEFSFGVPLSFSANDFMTGVGISFIDHRYKISLTGGYLTRVFAKEILVDENPNLSIQYRENRSLVYLGLTKRFVLTYKDNREKFGLYLGANGVYSYAKYKAVKHRPDPKFLFSPNLGIYLRSKSAAISLGYEYTNFNLHKVSAGRINLGLTIIVPTTPNLKQHKKQLWYF